MAMLGPWETREQVDQVVRYEERKQSEEGGMSVAYLLSDEFLQFAQESTALDNPTFHDLKDAIFTCKDEPPIGKNIRCPRDDKPG